MAVAGAARARATAPAATGCASRDTLEEALADADFVQESSPEVLAAKVALLADDRRGDPPGVVVASSTSGFGMTDMAVGLRDTPAASSSGTRSTRRT